MMKPPWGNPIRVRESTSQLIKYHNTDWWVIIREKTKRQKRKHQRRQLPGSCIFNKRYLKLFINAKTPWTVNHFLPPNNQCSSTSLSSLHQPPRKPLHTLEVSLVNFLIRKGKQYPEIWFISWCKELSRYHHHHHQVTTLLYHHTTPILTMNHHLYRFTCTPSPLHGSPPSSCHPYLIYV